MKWSLLAFCPKRGLALSANELRSVAQLVLRGFPSTISTVNLGRDRVEVKVASCSVDLAGFVVPIERLLEIAETEDDTTLVFFLSEGGSIHKVAFYRENRYYKLRNVGEGLAPTLEISGIHMHNIVGTDPWTDAARKLDAVRVGKGDVVLDVCTGLGYTASHAVLRGATVVTIEKDPAVLEVAEYNPWSRLLAHPSVTVLLGDAFEVLDDLPSDFFDAVVHDPPTFRLAGELYSLEFYRKLRRILKKGARVFHYTGWPGKHRGLDLQSGVVKRLRMAGLSIVRTIGGYGVVARAP